MAISAGVGFSQKPNPESAINEAYTQAISTLEGKKPSIIFLFASPVTYDQHRLLKELRTKGEVPIVGCSSSGEITSVGGSLDNSIALMAIYSDTITFVSGMGHDININSRNAGKSLAINIQNQVHEKPKLLLTMPDGLAGNGADIIRGIIEMYGQDFCIIGGSAADDFLFKKTYQYLHNEVMSNSVVGVGLYGEFAFGLGVQHGWIPIGSARIATKSKDNVLYELDGKPAIDLYESAFGKNKVLTSKNEPFARMAVTYPLGIPTEKRDDFLIRDPLTVDEHGAITCAAEIPQGAEVYMMIGSREEAIEGAENASKQAMDDLQGKKPKAAFLFNCIARKKLLMSKKHLEVKKIQSVIGANVPLIGFYTYGEQAPYKGKGAVSSFHNETSVIFLLAE